MDYTYVDTKNLKSLEDYAVFLTTGMLTLMTLHNFQVKAVEIGIMPDDMAERANTIMWDIQRLQKNYQNQLESTFELLPDDFNADSILENLKKQELTRARAMTRKKKT